MAGQFLVVGLGNPGAKYRGTYHNAGREVAERFAARQKAEFRARDQALVASFDQGWIMLPETFMNLSGQAVQPFARQKGIDPDRILVLVDDVYLLAGTIRIRRGGSDAGHNGLKSIAECLGTIEYPRIRIGIGPDPGGEFRTGYVLSRPRPEVAGDYLEGQERALMAVEMVMARGLDAAMDTCNAG